jgi:hypothetical protein
MVAQGALEEADGDETLLPVNDELPLGPRVRLGQDNRS